MRVKWDRLLFIGGILLLLVTPGSAATLTGQQWVMIDNTVQTAYTIPTGIWYNDNGLYVAIGYNQADGGYFNGTWFSANGTTFTLLNTTCAWLPRVYAASATFDGKMWLMAGTNPSTGVYFNDTWYSTDGKVWYRACPSCGWLPRKSSAATVYGGKLWISNGYDGTHSLKDTWFLTTANESSGTWTRAGDTADQYYGHVMASFAGKLWIIGATKTIWTTDGQTWNAGTTDATHLPDDVSPGANVAVLDDTAIVLGGSLQNKTSTSIDGITWAFANTTPAITNTSFGTGSEMITWPIPTSRTDIKWNGHNATYFIVPFGAAGAMGANIWVTASPPNASASPAAASGTVPFSVSWTDNTPQYAESWTWDFKDSYLSYTRNASHIFSAAGTFNVSFTPLSMFGSSDYISSVVVGTQQSQVIYYTQRQVRLKAVDAYGVPLPNANITVNYISSDLPNTSASWLTSAFGITDAVAGEMTSNGIAATGWTGGDGSSTFVMFPALRYGITLTNASIGLNHYTTLSPQDTDYVIYCPLSTQRAANSTQAMLGNTSLWVTFPNISFVTFNFGYQDLSGLTTTVNYSVWKWANVSTHNAGLPQLMYSIDLIPGTGYVTDQNYSARNIWGDEYKFVYNATRSAPF